MGVVGLETAFSELYTRLVRPGVLTLEKLVELMSVNPARLRNLPESRWKTTVFDLGAHGRGSTEDSCPWDDTPFAGTTFAESAGHRSSMKDRLPLR